jgi:hypothetical protein
MPKGMQKAVCNKEDQAAPECSPEGCLLYNTPMKQCRRMGVLWRKRRAGASL